MPTNCRPSPQPGPATVFFELDECYAIEGNYFNVGAFAGEENHAWQLRRREHARRVRSAIAAERHALDRTDHEALK